MTKRKCHGDGWLAELIGYYEVLTERKHSVRSRLR